MVQSIPASPITLPWFQVQNRDPVPFMSLREMHEVLLRLGFRVHSITDLQGQFLDLELSAPAVNLVQFQVDLPQGWTIALGYRYGQQTRETLDLLDDQGRLRAVIHQDLHEGKCYPHEAEFYCRYQYLKLPGFYKVPVDQPREFITDIVVDWAAVDPKEPNVCPVVVFHESRPVNSTKRSHEELLELLREAGEKELERIRSGQPRLHPPVYGWMYEHYPKYQNPAAYW